MDERDLAVRNLTYSLFVELGRAPTADEVAGVQGSSRTEVEETWQRLHDACLERRVSPAA